MLSGTRPLFEITAIELGKIEFAHLVKIKSRREQLATRMSPSDEQILCVPCQDDPARCKFGEHPPQQNLTSAW